VIAVFSMANFFIGFAAFYPARRPSSGVEAESAKMRGSFD
jgi:hypothetical protein